jgi:hypothetical protein
MRILAISYSQSGQLTEILSNFIKPLSGEIDFVSIHPKKKYSFPWASHTFFDTMPETVLEREIELEDINFKHEKYDLILLGYQPWFLSPSLPTTALLKNEEFKKRLKGTDVVTIIGARNMWINSQESVKKQISGAGGRLIGNVPFIDKNNNTISAITILHWMLTGKKEKKYGIFPKPGVSDQDIAEAELFGRILETSIQDKDIENFQPKVLSTNKVNIATNILFIEGKAKRLFNIWANLIVKKGTTEKKRKFWVNMYKYYLLFALFIIAPIVFLLYSILIRPFVCGSIKRKKEYFCSVNLK